MDRCLYLAGEAERFIEITAGRETRRVLLSSLRWAESRGNACTLYLESDRLTSWMSLEDLESQLDDPRFLRCQRSFLVNLDFVRGVLGSNFILSDGTQVPVRRESRAAMKTRYEQYLFEKARRRR